MTSKLTREQTQQIIDAADAVISALAGTNDEVHKDDTDKMIRLWDDLNDRYAPPEVVRELAAFRLAALDSEPVIVVGDDGGDALSYRRLIQSFAPGTKLYAAPQSAPVVPDERAAFNAWNNEDNLPIAGVGAKNAAWLAWQARAMLQAGKSPVIPDGLIAAINRLLDSDGSRGCYSAIQCGDAHDEIERLLAAAPQEVKGE